MFPDTASILTRECIMKIMKTKGYVHLLIFLWIVIFLKIIRDWIEPRKRFISQAIIAERIR